MTSLLPAFLLCAAIAADPAPPPVSHTVALGSHPFTLPEGFEIELAAGPPLVDRPIVADFDEQGRLYVCRLVRHQRQGQRSSSRSKPHRIVRLEDTDGDGRFDQAHASSPTR